MSGLNRPAPAPEATYAPGLRVEIRDAEWVIKRADLTSNGTYSLLVTGISELVRGRDARFLTEIDQIEPLHPETLNSSPTILRSLPAHGSTSKASSASLRQPAPTFLSGTKPRSIRSPINSTPHSRRSNRSATASCLRMPSGLAKPLKSAFYSLSSFAAAKANASWSSLLKA